jgi:hypothetical protein
MKTRGLVLSFAIAAALCLSTTSAPGKTASCPCSPCKCSPCTCGGSGKSGGGKHHDHHGDDHGSSVGVGGTVDLGGVGQRKAEADPFAASGGTTSYTAPDKPKKKEKSAGKSDPFANVELTGARAKAASNP